MRGCHDATVVFEDPNLVSCAGLAPVLQLAERAGCSALSQSTSSWVCPVALQAWEQKATAANSQPTQHGDQAGVTGSTVDPG